MIDKYLPKNKWIRMLIFLASDICMVGLCAFLALWVRFDLSVSAIPTRYAETAEAFIVFNIVITIMVFCINKMYSTMWGGAGIREMIQVAGSCFVAAVLQYLVINVRTVSLPRSYYLLWFIFMAVSVGTSRMSYRIVKSLLNRWNSKKRMPDRKRVMIVGGGEAGTMLIKELKNSDKSKAEPVCIIDDDRAKIGKYISGVPVKGSRDDIERLAESMAVDEIYIALPSASASEKRKVLEICQRTGKQMKILPGIYQLANGEVSVTRLRKVQIEDLLGRDPIRVDLNEIMGYIQGKIVLVTGGGGSIGSELCRQLAEHGVGRLIIFDMYENNAYDIQQELKRTHPELELIVLIGSVRNTNRLDSLFKTYHPDIVYHAAAHKHVPLMEDSPNEAIKNNVIGTYKTAKAAIRYGTKRFILISTDKAVNPTNIMGASKRLCEMVIQMCNQKSNTEFVAVRFGNVLGSNGSVIPLFKRQIEEGGPVTVTHKDIIRYFMTIPEAVSLVLQAGAYAEGGEIFILNMGEPVKILDMAEKLIRLSGYEPYRDIPIEFTGLRPGEKLYEELLMDEEGLQATKNSRIFIGHPIRMDYQRFEEGLLKLDKAAWGETEDIRVLVHNLVPEYHYEAECATREFRAYKAEATVTMSESGETGIDITGTKSAVATKSFVPKSVLTVTMIKENQKEKIS